MAWHWKPAILHFHREATLKTALEYSVKIRSQVQTITSAILPRNQSPCVSNSQRGWSWEMNFDSSTTFLTPQVGTNSLYGKGTDGFFHLATHALRASEALTPRFTDLFTDFEEKNDCFVVYLTYEPRKGQSPTLSRANCVILHFMLAFHSCNNNLNVWRHL